MIQIVLLFNKNLYVQFQGQKSNEEGRNSFWSDFREMIILIIMTMSHDTPRRMFNKFKQHYEPLN